MSGVAARFILRRAGIIGEDVEDGGLKESGGVWSGAFDIPRKKLKEQTVYFSTNA